MARLISDNSENHKIHSRGRLHDKTVVKVFLLLQATGQQNDYDERGREFILKPKGTTFKKVVK